jgi:hypothetical protein
LLVSYFSYFIYFTRGFGDETSKRRASDARIAALGVSGVSAGRYGRRGSKTSRFRVGRRSRSSGERSGYDA